MTRIVILAIGALLLAAPGQAAVRRLSAVYPVEVDAVALLSEISPAVERLDLNPFPVLGEKPFEQRGFDLEAHRGGRGLHTEESLAGYARALELGVSTLELDIVITKDNKTLIWHDPQIDPAKCRDTQPVVEGDPLFPYVGRYVVELTYAQIETLDCGFRQLPGFPRQEVIEGNRIATLTQLFDLVGIYNASDVWWNIETKLEAVNRNNSASPEVFVELILQDIRNADLLDRVYIQSFDWRSLPLVRAQEPGIPLVALSDPTTTLAGEPGPSPWLGGLDIDDFDGDLVLAVEAIGADIISPYYVGSNVPENSTVVGDPGFELFADAAFVRHAHAHGLAVVPWTVNDAATIAAQVETGVDGIISDYPDILREILEELGAEVPPGYPEPRGFDVARFADLD